MSIISMQVFSSDRTASIAVNKKAIHDADMQLQEIEEIKQECRTQINKITQKLLEIGGRGDLRRQQLLALKQQHDLASKRYTEASSYADLMHCTSEGDQAVSALGEAQKNMLEAGALYRRCQCDYDQQEARDKELRYSLESEHGALIEMIASSDMRKQSIQKGLEVAREQLGQLLYEEAHDRIIRYQNDVVSKENELESARAELQKIIPEELRNLEGYPGHQQKLKNLIPFSDDVTVLLEMCINLLSCYVNTFDNHLPTLRKVTGDALLFHALEGNTLVFGRIIEQLTMHDVQNLQASINQLKSILIHYRENGVR